MVWSHKKQFIFIHVPKTGGTSIERSLKMTNGTNGHGVVRNLALQHLTANEIKHILGEETFNQYTKISICRHPYSM
jgi:hypothetical protein